MSLCFPPFGEIVINFIRQNEIIVTHFFGKTQSLKLCPLYLFVFSTHLNPNIWISSFTYSIVKFHLPLPCVVSLFLHHREMIKQLSLTSPEFGAALCAVVGLDGLEPSTSRLSGARSSHLSYRPVSHLALGSLHFPSLFSFLFSFHPVKSEKWRVKSEEVKSLRDFWWRWRDSNPWPPACRAGALPTELHPHLEIKDKR